MATLLLNPKSKFVVLLLFLLIPVVFNAQIVTYDFETGLDGWTQDTGDDLDWTRQSGGTGSSGTGPNAASSGSYYMYAEMSNPAGNGDVFILTSPTIDLSSYTGCGLTFDYHMYSSSSTSDVGTLEVEINVNGGGWNTTIFTRSGSQNSSQSSWLSTTVDLSAYDGDSIQLRFIATRANSWRGDIAFDNVVVNGTVATPCTEPTAQPTGLTFSGVTDTQIDGSFTAASPVPDNYLVVYNTDGSTPTLTDTSTYNIGDSIGTSTVADNDGDTNFSITGLSAFTTYYFYIFSFNDTCTGGPDYYTVSPLTGNETTTHCTPNFTTNVEPITNVTFNPSPDINNTTSATIDGTPALEDFTGISTTVSQSSTYAITVEGNTSGNYTNYFRVFFDWNHDGDFTDSGESFLIGTITNSNGSDGKQATANITIPATASLGSTVMRVMKNYNADPTDPCASYSYGQAEDYTVNIVPLIAGPEIEVTGNGIEILDEDTTPDPTDHTDFGSLDISFGTQARTFTINNLGGTNVLNLTGAPMVQISGTHASDFTVTSLPTSPVASLGSTTFEITFDPSAVGLRTATVSILNDDADADETTYNFDIQGTGVDACGAAINTFPYIEDFESGMGSWLQGTGDTFDWTRQTGATPTTDTGPSGAHSGSYYMYAEATGNTSGTDTANLEGPCIDLTGTTNPRLTLFYHMFGAYVDFSDLTNNINYMGAFSIDLSTDGGTTYPNNLYTNTGYVQLDENSAYIALSFDLSAYIGQSIRIRLQSAPNTDERSDIAIDYISVTDRANPTVAPGGVTANLATWLKANDGHSFINGDFVDSWEDQGLGSHARARNSSQRPTYRDDASFNINFNPVIDFDSSYSLSGLDSDYTYDDPNGDFLEGDYGMYTHDLFVVILPDVTVNSTFGNMDIFCGDESASTQTEDVTGVGYGLYSARFTNEVYSFCVGTTTKSSPFPGYGVADTGSGANYNTVAILNARIDSGSSGEELYFNANNVETYENDPSDFSIVSDSRYWIGRSEAYESAMNGRIAEIITYSARKNDADLTDERNRIQSYLAIKYGITLGVNGTSQDYVDSTGSLIWDVDTGVAANDVFNYNITGIGRDDASELNQKQSKSIHATATGDEFDDITIGLTDIYSTNNENITNNAANIFSDRNFLCWGNNNASLNPAAAITVDMSAGPEVSVVGGTNVDFTSIQRTWKVVETGTVGTVKVSIPETMLSATLSPPGDYLMFISDSPSFSPTSEYRIMTDTGSNLETLFDFDGTKYITFGYAPERTFVRSIWFDGAVDYLDAGNVLDLNSSFTISAWIKTEDGNSTIVSKRDDGNTTGYDLGLDNSRNVVMSWNGGAETITSSVAIPLNEWHHIAVTYNGTTARLYIDGVEDTTANLSPPTSNSESFLIAAADGDEADTTSFFQGNIDEVRIWDVALTAEQLRFVMNQEIEDNTQVAGTFFNTTLGVTPTKNDIAAIPWSNLQGYYPMSTYTFTNCKDLSNNGYTAALRNLNTVDNQTAPLPYVSTADGDWDTASTWANGSVQTIPGSTSLVDSNITVDWNIVQISSNVTMDNSSLPVANNDNRSVLGLIVDNTYELEVQGTIDVTDGEGTGNGLTVSHYVGLDGKIDLEGESQLIQTTDSDLSVGANGILERDQQGNGNVYRYNDWSSPVQQIFNGSTYSRPNNNTFNISGVLFDGTNSAAPLAINFVGGYNGSSGTPISIADYWLYVYTNFTHDTYSAWLHAGNATILDVGEGFLMKGTNIANYQNYVFQGTPNNGDIQLTVSADNDYLVGNPYPSAIDANKFIDDNAASIEGALYFWDHFGGDSHNLADYAAGFATYNKTMPVVAPNHPNHTNTSGSGTKLPGRYIAVGQAFFVQGKGAGNKVIEFNNSQRTFIPEDSGTSSIFMKPSKSKKQTESSKNRNTITDTRKKIRLGFINTDGGHRQIGLGFDENTTEGYDYGYDALLYDYLKDEMYWLINNKKYVIQALPNFSEDLEIPLGIEVKDGGKVAIQLDGLENFEDDQKVFIKDLTTEEVFEITSNSFEIELDAGEYHDRFALVFQPRYFSLSEVELEEGFLIYMNNKESELEIQRIVDTEVLNIQLFNYLGQTMASWTTNLNERITRKPIYNMATGVYIVQINTKDGAINKKIVIE